MHVTAGTLLHGSHLPLAVWLYAIHMVGARKQSISAMQLAKDTNIAYSSSFALLHKIRRALSPLDERRLRCGVIEITRTLLDPEEDARPWPPSSWDGRAELVIAVERLADPAEGHRRRPLLGRLRASFIVPTSSTANFRERAIAAGAPVVEERKLLGTTIAGNVVAWLRGTFHGVSIKYLQAYLDEASFRFSRRRREDLVPALIGARLLASPPVTRAALSEPPRPPPPLPPAPAAAATAAAAAGGDDEGPGRDLSPESRVELERLLALQITSTTKPIAVRDPELFLVLTSLRPMLPLRLE